MTYRFLEDVALADVAFEAEGRTIEEMFASAGLAVTATMVKDIQSVETTEKTKILAENADLEKLLHDFLQEIIFYKDAELRLFSRYDVKIEKTAYGYRLLADAFGERLDVSKHELLVDVKAVSWHLFRVKREKNQWKAFVILDV